MTPRYRCPWCGSYSNKNAKLMRQHIVIMHYEAVERALRPIETYGTRKDPNAPPRRLKDHLQSNPGVSGEGDS